LPRTPTAVPGEIGYPPSSLRRRPESRPLRAWRAAFCLDPDLRRDDNVLKSRHLRSARFFRESRVNRCVRDFPRTAVRVRRSDGCGYHIPRTVAGASRDPESKANGVLGIFGRWAGRPDTRGWDSPPLCDTNQASGRERPTEAGCCTCVRLASRTFPVTVRRRRSRTEPPTRASSIPYVGP